MHEMSIATEIYALSLEKIPRKKRLVEVTIQVGEWSGIVPELLSFAWEALMRDTPHEGCQLKIHVEKVQRECPQCGVLDPDALDPHLPLCPHCGGVLAFTPGDGLWLTQIKYEESNENP